MIHMRQFNKFEEKNIAFLVNHNIEFTLVQITATGLKKSILAATAPMRTFFLAKGLHDSSEQQQGQEHKLLVPTRILDGTAKSYQTKTSLYRPVTKKGDPRLWVYDLGAHTQADDIHAICVFNNEMFVIDITRIDIAKCCESAVLTPLKDFIEEIYLSSNVVSEELLAFFRKHREEWFESEVTADTGIGRTIETMLGISPNSSKAPDYKGIELKSYREKRTSKKNVLFTQTPDWSLSKLKSGKEIVSKYGYDCGDGRLTYQNTVQCGLANSQGLILNIDQIAELLELQHQDVKVDDVAVWTLIKLHNRLAEKHPETFWIAVDNEYHDGKEYFRYRSIEHTRNPVLSQFDILLDSAMITVDLLLCRPSGHGDTYSFKIKKKAMPMLFPESITYQL